VRYPQPFCGPRRRWVLEFPVPLLQHRDQASYDTEKRMAQTQSRIRMIDPEHAEGNVKILFDAVTAMLGRVPHSYRVLAQSPLVAMMLVPYNAVLQRQGAGSVLPTRLKEMVVIRTSHINGCRY